MGKADTQRPWLREAPAGARGGPGPPMQGLAAVQPLSPEGAAGGLGAWLLLSGKAALPLGDCMGIQSCPLQTPYSHTPPHPQHGAPPVCL